MYQPRVGDTVRHTNITPYAGVFRGGTGLVTDVDVDAGTFSVNGNGGCSRRYWKLVSRMTGDDDMTIEEVRSRFPIGSRVRMIERTPTPYGITTAGTEWIVERVLDDHHISIRKPSDPENSGSGLSVEARWCEPIPNPGLARNILIMKANEGLNAILELKRLYPIEFSGLFEDIRRAVNGG